LRFVPITPGLQSGDQILSIARKYATFPWFRLVLTEKASGALLHESVNLGHKELECNMMLRTDIRTLMRLTAPSRPFMSRVLATSPPFTRGL
jgi:hypothetical protein